MAPTWNEIGLLAAIVVLRTVLNYFLQQEIDKAAIRKKSTEPRMMIMIGYTVLLLEMVSSFVIVGYCNFGVVQIGLFRNPVPVQYNSCQGRTYGVNYQNHSDLSQVHSTYDMESNIHIHCRFYTANNSEKSISQ